MNRATLHIMAKKTIKWSQFMGKAKKLIFATAS